MPREKLPRLLSGYNSTTVSYSMQKTKFGAQQARQRFILLTVLNRSFRFCDVSVRSLGKVEIAPAQRQTIVILIEIVLDVPALLYLDFLDFEQLYAENVKNRLVQREVLSAHGSPLQ